MYSQTFRFESPKATMMRRSLHYVIRVGNLMDSLCFYVGTLGMRVLRHEEFSQGCKATCNGPFGGKWSKTMVGYGPEDDHFVLEVVYNYGISSYNLGNFHGGFGIESREAFAKVRAAGAQPDASGVATVLDPNGYTFLISNAEAKDPFRKVILKVQNLNASRRYYEEILRLKSTSLTNDSVCLSFSDDQSSLQLVDLGSEKFDAGDGCGRTAFACPTEELAAIESAVKQGGYKILTNLTDLDTPGKATVSVVILADPDGHEICWVGDENYRALSKWEPETELVWKKKVDEAMALS
uniref:VOC domain-containing protein n=1 Tax=Trichuris muris TaxID=70415 RepID=A0A5S6QVH3_TRIMR